MKTSLETKLICWHDRLCLWLGVAVIIGVCVIGMCAALIRWHALDNWCAKQLEAE